MIPEAPPVPLFFGGTPLVPTGRSSKNIVPPNKERHGGGILLLLLLVSFLTACAPLERKGTPVYAGVRLDTYVDLAEAEKDLDRLKARKLNGLAVELLAVYDSLSGQPKISRTSLTQFSRYLPLLEKRKLAYTLVITHANEKPLFPDSLPKNIEDWFNQYRQEIVAELLPRTQSYPMERLVLGDLFYPLEKETDGWRILADSIRKHTPAKLCYSAALEHASLLKIWPAFDEIGLHYRVTPLSHEKMYHKDWHKRVGETALKYNKPVFIVAANLVEIEKNYLLQNKFRFWDSKVTLSGVTLNSIYTVTPLSDSVTYFGAKNDPALNQFLDEYLEE